MANDHVFSIKDISVVDVSPAQAKVWLDECNQCKPGECGNVAGNGRGVTQASEFIRGVALSDDAGGDTGSDCFY